MAKKPTLDKTHPDIAAEWHPTKNEKKSSDFTHGVREIAWWFKESCGHEWDAKIAARTIQGQGCPYCSGNRVIVGVNDLQTTHPELCKQWHPTKNKKQPTEYKAGSSRSTPWWKCEKDDRHEWPATIASRVRGAGCSVCLNKRIMRGINDFPTRFPDIFLDWDHEKNQHLDPYTISCSYKKPVPWLSKECGHSWKMSMFHRCFSGYGCPHCSGARVNKGVDDLTTTHPELSKQWHPTKNEKNPSEYKAGSNYRAHWQCDKNSAHEWPAVIYDRTRQDKRPSGCPECAAHTYVSPAEKEIVEFLIQFGISEKDIQTSVGRFKGIHELDIYLPNKKIAIEFNGLYWHSSAHRDKDYHYRKYKACEDIGIDLIQVWEDDWRDNKDLVQKFLLQKLDIIKNSSNKDIYSIRTVSKKETSAFFSLHHLRGTIPFSSKIHYGAFDLKNNLVGIMSLCECSNHRLEVIQYATSLNNEYSALSQLISTIRQEFPDKEILISIPNCISYAFIFENLGFTREESKDPKISFNYLKNNQRIQKEEFTDSEEMLKIFDAGRSTYILPKESVFLNDNRMEE